MKTIITAIVGLIAGLVVVILGKSNQSKSKKVEELKSELKKKDVQTEALNKHASEITKIKDDENETDKKIAKAETKEDYKSVLADIINANNSRVSDSKGNKTTTTSRKTSKKTSRRTRNS